MIIVFNPKRVIFEKDALDTEMGSNIYKMVKDNPKTASLNIQEAVSILYFLI